MTIKRLSLLMGAIRQWLKAVILGLCLGLFIGHWSEDSVSSLMEVDPPVTPPPYQLSAEKREKESAQRSSELTNKALEAERRLVSAVRCVLGDAGQGIRLCAEGQLLHVPI